nr:SMC-Scp complex subunit ScpB [Elusimicrobiota bacterium]
MSQTPAQSPEGEPAPGLEPEGGPAKPGPVDDEQLRGQLETLLFITDHPLTLDDLRKLTKVKDAARLSAIIAQLRGRLDESGSSLQILEIGGGFQMATRPAHGELVRKLFAEKLTMRLSTAAHETLAIVAYKQPLTRAEIEDIRGVEVIAALETLLEKRLLKVVGRKESVGRPLLYGTTADFMRHFGLRSLEDMPPVETFAPSEPQASHDAAVPEGAQAPAASGEIPADLPAEPAEPCPPADAGGRSPDSPSEPGDPGPSRGGPEARAQSPVQAPEPRQPIWPGAEAPSAEADVAEDGEPPSTPENE